MAQRPRHPNSEIEQAVRYAEVRGWIWSKAGKSGHAWGKIMCPGGTRGACQYWVNGTPSNPHGIARLIVRKVDNCPHYPESERQEQQ